MSTDAFDQINFNSRDWSLMKAYLDNQLKVAIDLMCQDLSLEETNKVRGRILFINMMLKRAEWLQAAAARQGR